MTTGKRGLLKGIIVGVCLFGFVNIGTDAAAAEVGSWKVKTDVRTEFTYDSNIYKLSATQTDRYDSNDPDDVTSGRFTDMESTSDLIISPALKIALKGKGLNGLNLSLKPSITYNLYAQNSEKNHADFALDIKQNLGSKSSIGLEFAYAPDVFAKNYLSDAVDGVDVGNDISAAERVYKAAHYDTYSIAATYGKRLWKGNTGSGALGIKSVDAEFIVGLGSKEHEAPFSNRSEDSILLGADFDMPLDSGVDLTFGYFFEAIDTPVSTEVLIRNENDFGVILNGDADATDTDARTVQTVDRSRNEHTFSVKAASDLGDGWNGYAKYDLRFQNYKSSETYDITRLDRNDVRHRIGLGADKMLTKDLSLGLGWRWTQESAGRDALAGTDKAETKSYSKHELSAVVAYTF